ncbi:regulatory protein, luxR family [Tranquillimonas rosea]|uniref:Regulatory protein, luxR family n=2 Tax=Tranquillimonas rosea TaxID=641238 RepID=A0A1H9WKM2_9RHOB|nr:regulatory protein, luxR family [Tranquillimonas rosea]
MEQTIVARKTLTEMEMPAQEVPVIAFVGNSVSFSDGLIRLIGSDFPDFQVKRYATLIQLADEAEAVLNATTTVVLEEAYVRHLSDDLESIQQFFPRANLALVYRDQTAVVELVRKLSRQSRLGQLCLLPMRMQYDNWRSVICLLINGEGYIHRDVINAALSPAPDVPAAVDAPLTGAVREDPNNGLTGRELQVLDLVSRGQQNKVVAAELGLSEHTVKLHMHHIINKLGVQNRTEATVWYLSLRAGAGRVSS